MKNAIKGFNNSYFKNKCEKAIHLYMEVISIYPENSEISF